MPSSDPTLIPQIIKLVKMLSPVYILDVGMGNGKYGFLFREALDFNHGRLKPETWETIIDGVEIEKEYISPIHSYVYNGIFIEDWLNVAIPSRSFYDLIFMGDVLEHWPEGDWQKALKKARDYSSFTLIVSPNWAGSVAQGAWQGHEHETHRMALSPQLVGGRCLFANSKLFMCVFDNTGGNFFDHNDICI